MKRSFFIFMLISGIVGSIVLAEIRETNGKKEFTWTQETLPNDKGLNQAWWIWFDKDMLSDPNKGKSLAFARTITVDDAVKDAWVRISAQGKYTLFINDRKVGDDDNVWTLDWYDIKPYLVKGLNQFKVQAKTDTWYAGLFVSGMIDLEKNTDIELLSDRSWNVTIMDEAFQKPEGDSRLAGEVVRGVNGGLWNNCGRIFVFPPDYYQLSLGVEVPGIAWARQYSGPRTKVAAIHPRTRQRDTVELIQRTTMDVQVFPADVYEFNHKYERAPFFPREFGLTFDDAVTNIDAAFKSQPDVIIFGGVGALQVNGKNLFYDVTAPKLRIFIQNGGGLIYLDGTFPAKLVSTGKKDVQGKEILEPDTFFEKELTAAPFKETPAFLAEGTPFAALPGFYLSAKEATNGFQKAVSLYQFGNGRIVRLNRNIGGPYGLFADRPGDNNDLHYQFYMSFAIKCLLWAARQEPKIRFAGFPATILAEHGKIPALTFTLIDASASSELRVAVRSPEKDFAVPVRPLCSQSQERGAPILEPIIEQKQAVKSGTVNVDLPDILPAGRYFVDVQVLDGNREANWAVAELIITSRLDIAAVQLSKPYIDVADGKPDALKATVNLTDPAPADTELRFSVIDNFDRVTAVQNAALAVGATQAVVQFKFDSFATTLGKIRVELRVKDAARAIKLAPFTAVRRDFDRYTLFGWFGGSDSHQGNVYLRVLGGLGFDAPRTRGISLDWLEAADMVAAPGYPAFPRYGAEKIEQAELLTTYGEQARKSAESQLRFDPLAFDNGDEFTYQGGEEQFSRILDYRKFLETKYGTIAALNRTWGSDYKAFGEIFPILPDARCQALKDKGAFYPAERFAREAESTRNYSRLIDQWLDNYRAFNDTARVCLKAIKHVLPTARVGCDCPMWPEGTSGHNWYQFLQEFDFFAPYGRGGEIIPEREARSYFHPEKGQFIGLTYGGYLYMAFNRKEEINDVEWQRWRIWNGLFQGFTSLWWYNLVPGADEGNLAPGFQPYPTLQEPAQAVAQFRNGFYDLLNPRKVRRDYGPIAIQDSIVSRLAVTFAPDDFSGGGLGHNMDTHFLMRILEDNAGYNFTLVADPQLTQGELRKYRVLMMPLSLAVGQPEAAALRRFVEGGGILIADIRPGIFNGSGNWDDAQAVPKLFGLAFKKSLGRKMVNGDLRGELFGRKIDIPSGQPFPADPAVALQGAKAVCEVDGVPLVTCNPVGKGYAICLNIPFNYYRSYMLDSQYAYFGDALHNRFIKRILLALFEGLNVKPVLQTDVAGDGEWPFWMDVACFPDGKAQYVGVTKGRKDDWEQAYDITIHPKIKGHVYDALNGSYFGEADKIPMTINRVDVRLFSILPYKVGGLAVKPDKATIKAGSTLSGKVRIECTGTPVRHIVNLQAMRPDGRTARYLTRNLETTKGRAEFSLPFALNEPTGTWKLEFTDVATQVKKSVDIKVQ